MVECLQSVKLGDVGRVLEGVYRGERGVECLDVLVKYLYGFCPSLSLAVSLLCSCSSACSRAHGRILADTCMIWGKQVQGNGNVFFFDGTGSRDSSCCLVRLGKRIVGVVEVRQSADYRVFADTVSGSGGGWGPGYECVAELA